MLVLYTKGLNCLVEAMLLLIRSMLGVEELTTELLHSFFETRDCTL